MMSHQPLGLALMQQCGSALLRALQNDSMVPLDLLVREAVQNSLDAHLDGCPVTIDFTIQRHSVDPIARVIDGELGEVLRLRYVDSQRALLIRDTGTTGLTGPTSLKSLKPSEPHGNLLKLVYEIGRSHSDARTGGSWGLGKSVYFRIGIGLVFYYSRIRHESGAFEERLAACFVEDEKRIDKVQRSSATGIAWWGSGAEGPVIDPDQIGAILPLLGIPRYLGDETGTTILVPFLRDNLSPEHDESEHDGESVVATRPWWLESDEEYIRVAIQRWYCARLDNPAYPDGPSLNASVGGDAIQRESMLPVFRVAQHLFNRAAGVVGDDGAAPFRVKVQVEHVEPLNSTLAGTTTVGRLAVARLTREQARMVAPDNNPSPIRAIFGRDALEAQRPVVGFLRSHGMIVRWDDRGDADGWVRGVPALADDFIIALFVPFGERRLHAQLEKRLRLHGSTFEAFLRGCELADHHQWNDPAGVTVVNRMRKRVAEKLKEFLVPSGQSAAGRVPLHAARALADNLLPSGFGTDGRNGPTATARTPSEPSARGASPMLQVLRVDYSDDAINVSWRVTWPAAVRACIVRLCVASEGRPFTADRWLKEAAGPFPLSLAAPKVSRSPVGVAALREKDVEIQLDDASRGFIIIPASPKARSACIEGTVAVRLHAAAGLEVRPMLLVEPTDFTRLGG